MAFHAAAVERVGPHVTDLISCSPSPAYLPDLGVNPCGVRGLRRRLARRKKSGPTKVGPLSWLCSKTSKQSICASLRLAAQMFITLGRSPRYMNEVVLTTRCRSPCEEVGCVARNRTTITSPSGSKEIP